MTYTTRFRPCFLAWARAKAREVTVLPPPVGTVRVHRPGARCSPSRMHRSRMAQRRAFSSPLGGNQPDMYAWSRSHSRSMDAVSRLSPGACPSMNSPVSA